MPRIEGIDDVDTQPAKKSEAQFLESGLLGTGKKDYNDQADDVLADTLDQDLKAAEDKKKKQDAAQRMEQ